MFLTHVDDGMFELQLFEEAMLRLLSARRRR
jgi:hypothetical protein